MAPLGTIKSLSFSEVRNPSRQGRSCRCIAQPEISERPRHIGVYEVIPSFRSSGDTWIIGFPGECARLFRKASPEQERGALWRIEKNGSTDQSESLTNTHRKGVTVPALGDISSQVDVVFLAELKS
jgi:hypothetical protein